MYFYVYVYMPEYMYVHHAHAYTQGGQRALGLLELELSDVGAGTLT